MTGRKRRGLIRSKPCRLAGKDDVKAALEDEGIQLVNALDKATFDGTKQTYARRGHIPGSSNVPWLDLKAGGTVKPAEQVRSLLADAGALDEDREVIAYCGGGIAATYVAFQLAQQGREDVRVYDGSLTEWTADENLPLAVTSDGTA